MVKETEQLTLDKQSRREEKEWARKVPEEFMQYGILAVGVSA